MRNPIKGLFRNTADNLNKSFDSFGKLIADGTTNELDLASHFEFDPERRRLYLNGSRQFPHYSSVFEFEDTQDLFKLKPGDGDKMHIESAQAETYTVQYVIQASFAVELSQSLQDGDTVKIGPYNGSDGWYLRHQGSQDDDVIDFVRERDGTEKVLESDVELDVPLTEWQRIEVRYNWYNVGEISLVQTYIDSDEKQQNREILCTGEKTRGPRTGNLKLWMEINQGSGNTGTELFCGSMSAITLGDVTNLTRNKSEDIQLSTSGTNGVWEPFYALKLDDSKYPNVDAELSNVQILQYSDNADVEVMAVSVDSSKTDASNFSTPDKHHSYSSVILESTSVSQVPKASDGSQADLTGSEKPGGHTVATATRIDGGGKNESARTATQLQETKKAILEGDVLVFCARSSSIGGDIDLSWEVSQNW